MGGKIWKFDFWHWFGIISAFGMAIWGSIVLYTYLDAKQGPQIKVKGNYNEFVIPPCNFEMSESDQILEKNEIERMLPEGEEEKTGIVNSIYDYVTGVYPQKMHSQVKKYKTLWTFEIDCQGDKGVSEALMELPFSGKYLMNRQGENSEFSEFNQRIKVGTIYPGNPIYIYVWAEEPLEDYQEYFIGNTSITFKGGSAQIDFPVKTTGILAWSIRNQNKPIIFAIAGFILILAIVMVIFFNVGVNAAQRRQETIIEFGKGLKEVE